MVFYFKIIAILSQYITISLGQSIQRIITEDPRTITEDPLTKNDWLYDIQASKFALFKRSIIITIDKA